MRRGERLYGPPGAEWLEHAPDIAADMIADRLDGGSGPWTIEEWSVRPAISPIPSAALIADFLSERTGDSYELSMPDGAESYDRAIRSPEVTAAIEALRELIAAKVGWREADEHVATWTISLDADGGDVFTETWRRGGETPTSPRRWLP
jgi:hypothetical protein